MKEQSNEIIRGFSQQPGPSGLRNQISRTEEESDENQVSQKEDSTGKQPGEGRTVAGDKRPLQDRTNSGESTQEKRNSKNGGKGVKNRNKKRKTEGEEKTDKGRSNFKYKTDLQEELEAANALIAAQKIQMAMMKERTDGLVKHGEEQYRLISSGSC